MRIDNLELDFSICRTVKDIARRVLGFLQQDPSKALSVSVTLHQAGRDGRRHTHTGHWVRVGPLILRDIADRIADFIVHYVDGEDEIAYRGATIQFPEQQ
jgi:translation initiation factor 2 beta subunit (eIF-2beta)/eIF-5